MAEQIRTVPGSKVALSIAGSDSSGGAGLQAHLKVFAVMGVFGASAVTALTAQNTTGVRRSMVLDEQWVEAQIDAVAGDLQIGAALTSMLGDACVVEVVAKAVKRHHLLPLVVDPVMVTKSGDPLIDDEAVKVMARKLLPLAAVITPSRHEAARLLGRDSPLKEIYEGVSAAREICKRYDVRACIVTGFHRPNDEEGEAVDLFYDGDQVHEVVADWRPTTNTHGSGCTFAAAITAAMALGQELAEAIQTAKVVVSEAIRQTTDLGHGISPVNHLAYLDVKKKK